MAKIISITNPVFSSEDQQLIDCMMLLDVFPVPMPFTANPNDIEEHGRIIHAEIMSGKYGDIGPYVLPTDLKA